MADYYPLIAKAVSGLEKSTGETRRALYDRARTALAAQARDVEAALSEPDITRERLALEEAIRKVEAEAARRTRSANGFRDTVAEAEMLGSRPTKEVKNVRANLSAKDGDKSSEAERSSILEIIRRIDPTPYPPPRSTFERLRREQEAKLQREEEERLRHEQEAKLQREEEERLQREQEAKLQREKEGRLQHKQKVKRRKERKIERPRGPARSVPRALDNVLPVVSFERGPGENIRIKPGTEFPLDLPLPSSKKDHAERLAACRSLAETLKEELSQRQFELLSEYRDCIVRYLAALPIDSDADYNFLPADTEARILRALFASEADTLPKSICARLDVFLQNHQGIGVFYPGLKRFYDDIRNGRIEEPLSLDAMTKFVAGINEYTPDVFDPSVTSAFKDSSTPLPHNAGAPSENPRSKDDPARPGPPPDPLGEIDIQKSRDFTFASMANSLWRVLSLGKKAGDTVEGWEKAFNVLREPFTTIANWLFRFYGGA